ncbi:MAG TPA: sugar ABC transporter permease, partial [Candidatus Tectomicrobia bacterium]|nr:sugar ABC transporter permease [Candidatus Tectomicrobia bacterium]
MATSATPSVAFSPRSKELRFQSGKISRFLLRDRTLGYLFLAPALLVVLCLVAYPFVNAVVLTFQAKTAGAPAKFIGLDNYRELLNNPVFWRTVFNTIFYTVAAVALKFVFGLGMALVLN